MANNYIYIKRTTVTGRTPNTSGSYATNSQYISTGELALNLTDQKMFSSNGTTFFEIGSNLVNQAVTNTFIAGNSIANVVINSSSITVANSTASVTINPGTTFGGGGSVNTAAIYNFTNTISFGNSTANTTISNSSVITSNGYVQSQYILTTNQNGTTYTFANTDSGTLIQTTNSSPVTLLVPSNLPANSRYLVMQLGLGSVTISNAAGISLGSRTGSYSIGNQYGTISIYMANSTFAIVDGNLANSTVISVPVQNKTSSYQLAQSDSGTLISITTGGVTVNGSVLSTNSIFRIYNNSTVNQTITQGSGATMYLDGTGTTSNRTLAQHGVATIIMVAANTFVISGSSVT